MDTETVCESILTEMGGDFCLRFGECKTCVATYALGIFNQMEMEAANARVRYQQNQ